MMNKKLTDEKRNPLRDVYEKVRSAAPSDAVRRFAAPTVAAVLSFAVSTVSPALGATPFAPSLLCAAPSAATATAVLAGTVLSAWRLGGGAAAFILVCFAVFAARLATGMFIAKERRPAKDVSFSDAFDVKISVRVAHSIAAALVLGIVNILSGTNVWYDLFGTVLSVTMTPLLCFAIASFADESSHPAMRTAGLGALLYALILSLSPLTIGGIDVSLVAGVAASLAAGRALGVSGGALIGTFIGLGVAPKLFAVFPICAVCSGALGAASCGTASVAASVLSLSWALVSNGISAISTAAPEIALGSALFYPAARLGLIPEGSFDGAAPRDEEPSSGTVSGRMRSISRAMGEMSRVFKNLATRLRNPDSFEVVRLCEDSFYEYCDVCAKREICHARESFESGAAVRKAASALTASGKITPSDLPQTMLRGCPSIDGITDGINRKFADLIESAIREDKLSAIADDYSKIAGMMIECVEDADAEEEKNGELSAALASRLADEGITYESLSVYGRRRPRVVVRGLTVKDLTCGAGDLRRITEEAVSCPMTEPEMSIEYDRLNMFCECRRRFETRHASYSENGRDGEANGDTACAFNSSDGCFYFLICDGMGSGRDASLTSKVSALFLKRMIGAGCTVPSALSLLNDFNRERNIECSSTVDLLRVDPFSAEAVFYKSGAAPSFILREGRLFKIECDTAPIGILDGAAVKSVTFRLAPDDAIVMISDGVLPDSSDAAWLYDMLSDKKALGAPLPNVAKNIAKAGRAAAARPDDTTVGVVRVAAA